MADFSAEAPIGAVVLFEGSFYQKSIQSDWPAWVPIKDPWGQSFVVDYNNDYYLILEKTYQSQKKKVADELSN